MSPPFAAPTLRTPRLLLRGFTRADAEAFAVMEADPEVRRYRGGKVLDRQQAWTSLQLHLGQWPLRGYGMFALTDAEDGGFRGFAGLLHPADWPEAELAYSLARPFWGRGLATEAVTAVRNWVFAEVGLPEVASFILSGNLPSQRLAARIGAVRDGQVTLRGLLADRWVHPGPGRGVAV